MSEFLYDYDGKLEYKFGKTIDEECHVTYDPSIIESRFKEGSTEEYGTDKLRDLSGGNKMSRMALSSSMRKDERKFKLKSLIRNGECKTLKSASHLMGLSERTIIQYLKELNIKMYDPFKGKYVGSQRDDAEVVEVK